MNIPDLIEQYATGAPLLGKAIAGLSAKQLNAVPIAGTWSIQQIVLHLMDADLIASDRMKRVIAEENPTIIGFDEGLFAKNLFYEKLDAHVAAEIFQKNRDLTAVILRNLPASAFARKGTHSERGPLTLELLLQTYTDHLHHHLAFIEKKRQLV